MHFSLFFPSQSHSVRNLPQDKTKGSEEGFSQDPIAEPHNPLFHCARIIVFKFPLAARLASSGQLRHTMAGRLTLNLSYSWTTYRPQLLISG